jgi:manganese transport protein
MALSAVTPFAWVARRLTRTASAPFCPSEVQGSVAVPPRAPVWRRALLSAGPGLLVAVGYMDPGNWATDIAAGSHFGYGLLFVVAATGLAAMLLQVLAMRLGLVTGRDLAQMARDHYPGPVRIVLWLLAELAIIATDVAEVLGAALAFHLLIGVPLWAGVVLTGFDTLIVLGLKGHGFRQIEAIVLALVTTIAVSFVAQLALVHPDWPAVAHGLLPARSLLGDHEALYLAVGILGATVMPHNLYLHSSAVQTRRTGEGGAALRDQLHLAGLDTAVSLALATLVNGAILVLAGAAFHATGHNAVEQIDDAWRLLTPVTGARTAALLFGIALLASGQSATFTGTIAGQVVLEGFLDLKIPCWKRRVITRALALLPALAGLLWAGDQAVGTLLVFSQVVLSLQLPFAIWPLLRFTGDRAIMGSQANGALVRIAGWALFVLICVANIWLVLGWL